jgi:hypothetical protein
MDLHISHFSDLLKLQAQNPKKTQISKPKLETGSDLGERFALCSRVGQYYFG